MAYSKWHNPTSKPVTVRLPKERKIDALHTAIVFEHVVIGPGETEVIDSAHDGAIQAVRDNEIIGGLAPQLQKVDGPELKVAPALLTEKLEAEQDKEKLLALLRNSLELDELRELLTSKKAKGKKS